MPRIIEDIASRTANNQASVVSTFVRPVAPRTYDQAGRSVMNALGVVSAEAEKEKKKKEEADKRKGQLEGLRLSASEDGAKIKEGMYPNASESFMAGLRESTAQATAYQTVSGWKSEYEQLVRDNPDIDTDPSAFQQWLGDKVNTAVATVGEDGFSAAGAVPVFRMGMANMLQQHVAGAAQRVEAREFDALDGIVTGKAETHDWSDDPDGEKLIAAIAHEADIRVGKGLSGTQVNNTVVDSMVNLSRASNDTRYLRSLITAHDKGIYKLSSEQFSAVEAAEDQVLAEAAREESAQESARKKAKGAAEDAALAQYGASLAQDPQQMPDQRILKTNPELYRTMLSLRTTILKANASTDPAGDQAAAMALFRMANSPDMKRLSYRERTAKIASYIEQSGIVFSDASLGRVYSQLGREQSATAGIKDYAIQGAWTTYHKMLRSGLRSLNGGALNSEESAPIELDMEALFREYISDAEIELERAGRTVSEMTREEKDALALKAIQYAARATLMTGDLDELGIEPEVANRYLKRIGMSPLDVDEVVSEDAAVRGSTWNTGGDVGEVPSDRDPIQELEDNAQRSSGLTDKDLIPMAIDAFSAAVATGVIQHYSPEDVERFATAALEAIRNQTDLPTVEEVMSQQ